MDLDELERVARAATEGPWRVLDRFWVQSQAGRDIAEVGTRGAPAAERDAAFIAATDPRRVLALIERVRRAEETLRRVKLYATHSNPILYMNDTAKIGLVESTLRERHPELFGGEDE